MSNSHLKIKNGTEVTSKLSSNLIGNSNAETDSPFKLLLNDTQVSNIRKTSANGSSANKKDSKTQLSKMIQWGGFNIVDLINPRRVVSKIVNKAEDVSNKVLGKTSKEKILKKNWNRNNSNTQRNESS